VKNTEIRANLLISMIFILFVICRIALYELYIHVPIFFVTHVLMS
jgi:hypothetical protein